MNVATAGEPASTIAPARGPQRFQALDGLRGVLALIVVLHHAFLTQAALATSYVGLGVPGPEVRGSLWQRALTSSPLHVIWAGSEAVFAFFVLSGLVLALPALRKPLELRSYYVRRVLRLYVPVWCAVALGVLSTVIVQRHQQPGATAWLNEHRFGPSGIFGDAALVNTHGAVMSVLWSLKWELLFSVLLPVFVWGARFVRDARVAVAATAGLVLASGVGSTVDLGALRYLPMFGLGVVLAVHHERLIDGGASLARRLGGAAGPLTVVATAGVVVLFTFRWTIRGLGITAPGAVVDMPVLVASLALVLAGLAWPPVQRVLEARPVHWLGERSFSLYLVHEPVIVALGMVWRGTPPFVPLVAISLLWSLVLAAAFYRWVEVPSIGIARSAGSWAAKPGRLRSARIAPVEA